jgi:hypothetical protein
VVVVIYATVAVILRVVVNVEGEDDYEQGPNEESTDTEEIERILKRSVEGAEELDRQLRRVFRLPDKMLYLD